MQVGLNIFTSEFANHFVSIIDLRCFLLISRLLKSQTDCIIGDTETAQKVEAIPADSLIGLRQKVLIAKPEDELARELVRNHGWIDYHDIVNNVEVRNERVWNFVSRFYPSHTRNTNLISIEVLKSVHKFSTRTKY